MDGLKYPYGFCGMPCALCTRYRTDGVSRCGGCSAGGYYTDVCKVHHCCRDRNAVHCGRCADFPCARLGKMGDFRDLDTGGAKLKICAAVAERGFEVWYADYAERADMLTAALERYNNGRMKRYLCELFIRRETEELRKIMRRADELSADEDADDKKKLGELFKRAVSELDGGGE